MSYNTILKNVLKLQSKDLYIVFFLFYLHLKTYLKRSLTTAGPTEAVS